MTESEVVERIRSAITKAGSMRKLAKEWGISVAYISDCVNGRRCPGPAILGPLGLKRVVSISFEPDSKLRRKR